MEELKPIGGKDRIQVIDMIRGFAIFGIFLVNMLDFSSPWLYTEIGYLWKDSIDISAEIFIDIFAQASFYTLFSFLFGFGTVIFKERAIQKNYRFVPLYLRRLFTLLGIGMLHAFLIWHGDILISYAITGFFLLLFINLNPKTLLNWAIFLILLPSAYIGAMLAVVEARMGDSYSRVNSFMIEKSINIYSSGSFAEITQQRINDWAAVNWNQNSIFIILPLLAMFLLGAAVAKVGWLKDIEQHLPIIKKVWVLTFLIAVVFKFILPYLIDDHASLMYFQGSIGGPASAIFYAFSFALITRKEYWSKRLHFFSYVGRLSLSNYLLQSIIGTLIFYSYGLGFYGQVSPLYAVLLVIAIYVIQIFLSRLWLKRFRIGPVEWIWRSITYLKRQPLRK